MNRTPIYAFGERRSSVELNSYSDPSAIARVKLYLISTLSGWWLGLVSDQLLPDFQSGTLPLSYLAIQQSGSSRFAHPTTMLALMVFVSGHQPSPY